MNRGGERTFQVKEAISAKGSGVGGEGKLGIREQEEAREAGESEQRAMEIMRGGIAMGRAPGFGDPSAREGWEVR